MKKREVQVELTTLLGCFYERIIYIRSCLWRRTRITSQHFWHNRVPYQSIKTYEHRPFVPIKCHNKTGWLEAQALLKTKPHYPSHPMGLRKLQQVIFENLQASNFFKISHFFASWKDSCLKNHENATHTNSLGLVLQQKWSRSKEFMEKGIETT